MSCSRPAAFLSLAAAAAVSVLSLGCGGAGFDPASAIPAGSTAYGRLDTAAIRSSGEGSWAEDYLESLEENQDYVRIRDDLGFDPVRDLDRIWLGFGPHADRGQGVLVFEGAIDPARLAARLAGQDGYELRKVAGVDVHVLPNESGERYGFYFPAEGWAVMAGEGWIDASISAWQGNGPSVDENEALQSLVDHVDREDQFWLVMQMPEEAAPPTGNPMIDGLADDIDSVVVTLDFSPSRELHFTSLIRTGEPSSAKTLESTASGFLQMGRMMLVGQAPKLAELIGKLQFSVEGNLMKAELRAEEELLRGVRAEIEGLEPSLGEGGSPGTPGAPAPTPEPAPPPAPPAEPGS